MEELYVDQIMSRPVETVPPSTPIHDAAEELIKHDVGALVVVDDANQIEGLLTATDFVLIVRDQMVSSDATVAEFMRTDVITTKRNAPVSDVIDAMLEHLIHHVPVVDGGEVIGMVTTMDLTASLSRSR
jgi:CBS domain-containing protein